MATTPNPLVWDFYREVGASGRVGGVVYFYDESGQSLYNSDGLQTQLAKLSEGRWDRATWDTPQQVSAVDYLDMDLDHPYNGVVFGVGVTSDGQLQFLRYVYAMDCTYLLSSGNLSYSNSNSVAQLKANIMNTDEGVFMGEASLFQPGSKASLKLLVGDESPYDMCVTYLDSVDYSVKSATVPLSGRNITGFKLADSTFDDTTEISGSPKAVVSKIMELAGIDYFLVENVTDNRKHKFDPSQTLLSGLEQICETYSGWKVVELPDGRIIVGSSSFISSYQSNSYYVFDAGSVFKRKTKRSSDAAYSRVRATGQDADGNDLDPVIVEINNYPHWNLPKNKTYHASAPEGLSQLELEMYANHVANSLQYVGIGEDFTGSIQPHLLIGDVAAVDNNDDTMTTLGLVTSIKHSFGKSGFTTDFSTDSGGILTDARSGLTTVTKSLSGYTRKQTLKDLIQVASGSSAAKKTSGTVSVVAPSTNALTLEGKTYSSIIADTTFKPGDSTVLPSLVLTGSVTEGGTTFIGNIFLGRAISAETVTITSCLLTAKQNGIYVIGTESAPVDVSGSISVAEVSLNSGALLFKCIVATAPEGVTDGEPVTYQISNMTLSFSNN